MNARRTRTSPRLIGGLAAALAATLALTACGGNSTAGSSGNGNGAATITVWTWKVPGEGLKAAIPGFNKMYPNIKVNVTDVGNPAIWDKITTGMAAGGSGLPDVMNIGIDYMGNYLEKFPKSLANLNDLGAGSIKADFPASVWNAATRNGASYGVPYEANTAGLYFRKDLFQKAGVDMNTVTTWDDLLEAGKKIYAATGVKLFTLDEAATVADSANLWQLLAALGGSFYFDAQGQITMNSPAAVAALSFLARAKAAGIVDNVASSSDAFIANVNGTKPIATIAAASWAAGTFVQSAPAMAGKWGVRKPPAMAAGGLTAAITGATYLSISATSPNKAAAYKFVRYTMDTLEGWQAVYKGSGLFPAYSGMWKTPDFTATSSYWGGQPVNQLFIDELGENTPGLNYTSDYARALKAYTDAQTQVMLQGADPQTALNQAAQSVAQQTKRKIATS